MNTRKNSNNNYYMIIMAIILMLIQGHLKQKLGMLYDYFINPSYEFFTTFSTADILDLAMHGLIPVILITIAVRNIIKEKKTPNS